MAKFSNGFARLPLGADEQHPTTARRDIPNSRERAVKHGHRLTQIDNVNAVANTEQIGLHSRVPAASGVSEVNASLQ